jgi:hypothetical protein
MGSSIVVGTDDGVHVSVSLLGISVSLLIAQAPRGTGDLWDD